ncbi:DUF4062 domain-containing protein [Thalassospira sp. MIT1370]|uniref:DUF4062 domain-containing protein n=1 Tax=unclassified Thalassospira TaxID=2648997 RepID=UPI00399B87D1
MAGLRVFVSSTCYDLTAIRSQLRMFIQGLGHEPLMSDYSDILYDPRVHTHTSCVDEVANADVVVLIVGSRYGGKSVPEALTRLDFDLISKESKSKEYLDKRENLSVTQLEILKAVEVGVPVFTFVDNSVWHDHALYEKNKEKSIIGEISFPSIEKPETAPFIFEFINFLRHRVRGNSVFNFSKIQDIEDALRRQWSSLFQKLVQEQRGRHQEVKRLDDLTEQFENLKTAILTSIGTTNEREVARGVVRFRRLMDFVIALRLKDSRFLLQEKHSWEELLDAAEIVKVLDATEVAPSSAFIRRGIGPKPRLFLLKSDETFFEFRGSTEFYHNLALEWDAFMELPADTREIIVDALSDMRPTMGPIRYVREPFRYFMDRWYSEEHSIRSEPDDLNSDSDDQ